MRKRQFGSGKRIYASDHNLAQDYIELNTREIAIDGGIRGIITGGVLNPHSTLEYTVILQETIARTSTGERIVVASPTNIFIKPSVDPGAGKEVYVAAYMTYDYQLSELDTDGDGVPYYKDYQNSYTISTTQGVIANTGNAVKPDIPANGILLCDILYNTTLYASGQIQQSDIDTLRQDRFDSQVIVNLQVSGTTELVGPVTIRSDVDMDNNNFTNVSDPTSDDHLGDRGYNDARYVNTAGDTMTGTLTVPDIVVSSSMTVEDLNVNGSLTVDDTTVLNDNTTVVGNFSVTSGDASIAGSLSATGTLTGKSLIVPWAASTAYTLDEVVVFEEGIYKCSTAHTSSADFLTDILKWESIGGGGGTTHRVAMTAHGFIVGDVLRYDSTVDPDGYVKALADHIDTTGQFVVIRVLDADNFIISSGGYFQDLTYTVNFTPNTWYYCSDTTAGLLTSTEPQLSNPILYAITANEAFVFVHRPEVGATVHVDEFISSTGQVNFTLYDQPIHEDYITVSIDGSILSQSAYTLTSSTGVVTGIQLVTPTSTGQEVRIQYIHNMFNHPGASLDADIFTVTSTGETQFTLTYSPLNIYHIIVTVDGVLQHDSAYSLVGNVLTFATGLIAGNEVRVLHIRNLNALEPPNNSLVRDHFAPIGIYKYATIIQEDITLAEHGLSVGPISVDTGYTVTVPTGYNWIIL